MNRPKVSSLILFPILKDNKLPGFDRTYSAWLADLDTRGLWDETHRASVFTAAKASTT